MSEFTKGEWKVSGKLPYIVAITSPRYMTTGKTIVSRGQETGGQDWPVITREEREANARLIAAAPELYEACKAEDNARSYIGSSDVERQLYNKAAGLCKAALAKAEEKQ